MAGGNVAAIGGIRPKAAYSALQPLLDPQRKRKTADDAAREKLEGDCAAEVLRATFDQARAEAAFLRR